MVTSYWKQSELIFLIVYALGFYAIVIHQSLQLSHDHHRSLFGLRRGWISNRLNDLSDAQWRNFRGNLPVLTLVLGMFTFVANALRSQLHLKGRGMSVIWFFISLSYLSYLHGACVVYILAIASMNFILVKIFAKSMYFSCILWIFNIFVLIWNRIYEGYSFSVFGQSFAFLDSYRGTFRWQICFNFVILRMISFGFDYHWALKDSRFDHKKHMQRCSICSSGKTCYLSLQVSFQHVSRSANEMADRLAKQEEKSIQIDKFSFITYLSYLVYAPLYIAGPIISFNAFASQLEVPQKNYSIRQVAWYGFRWVLSLLLMELMTHFFYYNAFVISGSWRQTSPFAVFIVGYGVLNFMWLKFLLIWRYFRFWALVCSLDSVTLLQSSQQILVLFPLGPQIGGIEAPENMPRCINNCYNLESFWKNWHASFNKWLVRYMYVPLGGSQRKALNVWFIFTFVAIWHDLEWKLLSWAWLTCLFFIPEMIAKSVVTTLQAKSAINDFVLRELSAVAGAITITCLMVANLVGYVIGPSGINWLISRLLQKDGLPVLGGIFTTFYVGTKLMFHIRDGKQNFQ